MTGVVADAAPQHGVRLVEGDTGAVVFDDQQQAAVVVRARTRGDDDAALAPLVGIVHQVAEQLEHVALVTREVDLVSVWISQSTCLSAYTLLSEAAILLMSAAALTGAASGMRPEVAARCN